MRIQTFQEHATYCRTFPHLSLQAKPTPVATAYKNNTSQISTPHPASAAQKAPGLPPYHLPCRLNLRAPGRARTGKRPIVIEDFDLVNGEGRREHDRVEDFVVSGFDGGCADGSGEVLGHEDSGWSVEGKDVRGGGVAEGGLVGLEEGPDGLGVGGH